MIELALKFDAISIYICTCSRNYHIRLVWSSNGYHDWIPTETWCHLCTCSRNYHIRLVWSLNESHDWIPTEIWCHLCTRSRNYHIRLVHSPNRYHRIWNLLKKPHLVIPIISILVSFLYASKSPSSLPYRTHHNLPTPCYSNKHCNAVCGNCNPTLWYCYRDTLPEVFWVRWHMTLAMFLRMVVWYLLLLLRTWQLKSVAMVGVMANWSCAWIHIIRQSNRRQHQVQVCCWVAEVVVIDRLDHA